MGKVLLELAVFIDFLIKSQLKRLLKQKESGFDEY